MNCNRCQKDWRLDYWLSLADVGCIRRRWIGTSHHLSRILRPRTLRRVGLGASWIDVLMSLNPDHDEYFQLLPRVHFVIVLRARNPQRRTLVPAFLDTCFVDFHAQCGNWLRRRSSCQKTAVQALRNVVWASCDEEIIWLLLVRSRSTMMVVICK